MFAEVNWLTQSKSPETTQNLRDYLHRRQGEMTALLSKLVIAESPSTVPAAQKPVLTILQQELRQRGYRVRHLPGQQTGGHLLALERERRSFGSLRCHPKNNYTENILAIMPILAKLNYVFCT